MIIELEINGARVLISGDNLSVSVTGEDGKPRQIKSSGVPLRDYLEVSRITQAEFAESIGIHPVSCNRLVNGNRRPSWDLVAKIAEATGGIVTAESWIPAASDDCPDGDSIKEYRKSIGVTQHQFAELLGVTQATISRWECGAEQPRGAAAVLLYKMLSEASA